jgi:hypothetical protein
MAVEVTLAVEPALVVEIQQMDSEPAEASALHLVEVEQMSVLVCVALVLVLVLVQALP